MTNNLPDGSIRNTRDELDAPFDSCHLVVRCVERIGTINSPHAEQISFTFKSWQISRLMRRDFHYLASSMYFANKVVSNRGNIGSLLQSIEDESINLSYRAKDIISDFLSQNIVPIRNQLAHTVEFRIVDRSSRALFDSITQADACVSEMGCFLEPPELDSVLRDFKRSISVLNNFLIEHKKE